MNHALVYLLIILVFLFGIVVGFYICSKRLFAKSDCILNIDRSIPYEEPYIFLELRGTVDELSQKEYAILRIKKEDYASQKIH